MSTGVDRSSVSIGAISLVSRVADRKRKVVEFPTCPGCPTKTKVKVGQDGYLAPSRVAWKGSDDGTYMLWYRRYLAPLKDG